jgi:SAM-dependent methyltransferase
MLPNSYFDKYADPGVEDRSYNANWKRYGFQLFERYLSELAEQELPKPGSALDIGAANGAAIEEMQRLGIKARGIESSRYIYDQAKPETKSLIALGDACGLIKRVPVDTFDVIYETAAQYIPKNQLRQYLVDLFNATKRDLVIVLHTRDYDPTPHDNQVNFLSNAAWRTLLTEAGFVERGNIEDPPYWFCKPQLVVGSTDKMLVAVAKLRDAIEVLNKAHQGFSANTADVSRDFVNEMNPLFSRLNVSTQQLNQLARQFLCSPTIDELVLSSINDVSESATNVLRVANKLKTRLDWLELVKSSIQLLHNAVEDLRRSIKS